MAPIFGSNFTRSLWTDVDHILLVYVGSAAEFALVEENHWLFFTHKLPSAPLERLVSTLVWNRKVMEVSEQEAMTLAQTIRGFHDMVEEERKNEEGGHPKISNQAFREVGGMLIDYGLLGEAYLSGQAVSEADQETYYQDQRRFFEAMGITGWEDSYQEYAANRETERERDLQENEYTWKLFEAYRKDLGWFRYHLVILFMGHFLPEHIRRKLDLKRQWWFTPCYRLYPKLHGTFIARFIRWQLLPKHVRVALAG